jgi:CRISPR-associated endoribonuclease Cas6
MNALENSFSISSAMSHPDLLGLTLTLQSTTSFTVPSHYTTELHSWFLDQVRRVDFELSSYMHDGQSEKPFTVSSLLGTELLPQSHHQQVVQAHQPYQWTVTALATEVATWMQNWSKALPKEMRLRSGTFTIANCTIAYPATTYAQLWEKAEAISAERNSAGTTERTLCFTFLSPTSFRHYGNHLPLPMPDLMFKSYLRRWNHFVDLEFDSHDFKQWVSENVIILRHQLQSSKVQAGKQGSVTGFTGAIQFGLTAKAKNNPDYVQLIYALEQLAPYCGTGHKTTFGLGQTRLGWLPPVQSPLLGRSGSLPSTSPRTQVTVTQVIASSPTKPTRTTLKKRITELTKLFLSTKKRQGGDRARLTSELWATLIARRETGESLKAIAQDLELNYETAKKHMTRATEKLRQLEDSSEGS